MHAHMGQGKQVPQGDKRAIHATLEISRRGIKKIMTLHSKDFIEMEANAKDR